MSKFLSSDDMLDLQKIAFFSGLAEEDVEALLKDAVVVEEEKNSLLFSQGDRADRFYVVLEGRVKLYTTNEEGEESVVEVFEPVSSFAEAAMFASGLFPVNGQTVVASKLVLLQAKPFMKVLQERPHISGIILQKMATRYHLLMDEVVKLKTQSPAQRLGAFFLSLLENNERDFVELPYDKNLIAARVGMTPESLSRALVRLKKIGVACDKKELQVKDIEVLKSYCGEEA